MSGLLIVVVIYILVLALIIANSKAKRIERKKRYFEKVIDTIKKKEEREREHLVKKRQATNMKELGVLTKRELNRFKMEIPPRLYQNANTLIDACVSDIDFKKLYSLYDILINTSNEKVLQDLNQFVK